MQQVGGFAPVVLLTVDCRIPIVPDNCIDTAWQHPVVCSELKVECVFARLPHGYVLQKKGIT
jgi:hypothetical protein